MKRKSFRLCAFFALAITAAFFASSCKKSNSSSSSSGAMSITLSGTTWQSSYFASYYSQDSDVFILTGISTKTADTSIFQINFPGGMKVNTPFSTDTTQSYIGYYDDRSTFSWGAGFNTGSAIIKITSLDTVNHKIAGTVTGTMFTEFPGASATDSVVMTNGQFNVSYTVQP
jgi:hypothetical protein